MKKQEKMVILIDDDDDIHQLVKLALSYFKTPVKLVSFYDVYTALDYLKSGHDLSLVILDLCLKTPHDGSLVINEIQKSAKEGARVPPVIISSSLPNGNIADYIKELGASDYLQKPVDPNKLSSIILKYLENPFAAEEAMDRFQNVCISID